MDAENLARSSKVFAALSNPARLRITELVISNEMTVSEVAEWMGISLSGASQHLSHLARAGILSAESRGSTKVYRARGPRIGKIIELMDEFCRTHATLL